MKLLTLPRPTRSGSRRQALYAVGGLLCSLAVLFTVDGVGVMRGALLSGVTTASVSSAVLFQEYASCRQDATKQLTLSNPDGARLVQGEKVAGRSQDDPLGDQFTRDRGLKTAACLAQNVPPSLLGNMLMGTTLELSFLKHNGVPPLGAEDLALRQRLLDQIKTANAMTFRQASMNRAALKRQVTAMCTDVLGQLQCVPWRVFAASVTDGPMARRLQAFQHPETLIDRLDNSVQMAAYTDVAIAQMDDPVALTALQDAERRDDWGQVARHRTALHEQAMAQREAQYASIAKNLPTLDDVQAVH